MANLKSSKKDVKRSRVNAKRNGACDTAMKNTMKKFFAAVEGADAVKAAELMQQAQSKIGLASKKGVIKKNAAARRVSRLARRFATIKKVVA
jgi:small subunit ribosomal protein S20